MRQSRIGLFVMCLIVSQMGLASVLTTKHNLSTSGPGTVKSNQESQVCIFCHTPHNAQPDSPLWNRQDPGTSYTLYNSSTANANIGQPTGASVLCLSCHDGTIALGKVLSRTNPITMQDGVTTMPAGSTNLGTDLSDDHPISFAYTASLVTQRNGELTQPGNLTGAVKLDNSGRMQCTSCHDAHNDNNGKFLVVSNLGGALCETCHLKPAWGQTPHNISTATWDGLATDPWPNTSLTTVSDNACQNCHMPHSAGAGERLLNYVAEETNCLVCHNSHVAQEDVANEFTKSSTHPIENNTGRHTPDETAVVNSRHVECVDCHDPHAAKSGGGNPAGPLTNVRGITITGAEIQPITSEYQLCLRCHGDSTGKPAPPTPRVFPETNLRLEFSTSNPSYHPVAGIGRNPNVPSLQGGLTTSSIIQCTDCHNNDNGPNTGGNGPNGPHGSNYPHLLERQFVTQDPASESASAYALCYNCHNRNSILNDQSFPLHQKHIGGENASCNVCHDPHGSGFARLINFDTSVVSPSGSGRLEFNSTGTFSGECYVNCHGKNHNPCTYGGGGGGGGGHNCMGGGGGGGGM